MLANLRLETPVPVSDVSVNHVALGSELVGADVDENQEPPGKSTVVRRSEDPAFFSERPAVRSLPFRTTR